MVAHLALHNVQFAHTPPGIASAQAPGQAATQGRVILSAASLSIERGDFVVFTGPSGAGKSTTLRLFCRLEEPQAGAVLLSGENIAALPPALLRRRVAYLQQTPVVVAGSVRENLLLPFSFAANADLPLPAEADLTVLLDLLGAGDIPLSQEAATLSVGQRQRLCLARALLLAPEAMLLDEPTSALDQDSAAAVLNAAEAACLDRGMTIVLVSHTAFTPRRVAPRRLTLSGGTLAWTQAS